MMAGERFYSLLDLFSSSSSSSFFCMPEHNTLPVMLNSAHEPYTVVGRFLLSNRFHSRPGLVFPSSARPCGPMTASEMN